VIRNIVELKLIYYSDYNLLMYLKTIILLFLKVIVKLKNKSLDSSLSLSFNNELLNIEKIVRVLIIANFIMHF